MSLPRPEILGSSQRKQILIGDDSEITRELLREAWNRMPTRLPKPVTAMRS